MSLDQIQKSDLGNKIEEQSQFSLSSASIDEIRSLCKSLPDLKDDLVAPLHLFKDQLKGTESFCSEPMKETDEQHADRLITKNFGPEMLERLKNKDYDWLTDHIEDLQKGFASIFDRHQGKTAGQIAGRMKDLSDGMVYLKVWTETRNPFIQYNTSPNEHMQVMLKRGRFRSDDELHHEITRYSGPSQSKTTRYVLK